MKHLLLIILVLSFVLVSCCECDKKEGKKDVISGLLTWNDWKQGAGWESYDAAEYSPNIESVNSIKQSLATNENIHFIVFAASWCPDCESGIPEIFKLFSECSISEDKVKLYGVDRSKREMTGTAAKYDLKKVPTVFVLNGEEVIGSIVEFPTVSWEEDLVVILEK